MALGLWAHMAIPPNRLVPLTVGNCGHGEAAGEGQESSTERVFQENRNFFFLEQIIDGTLLLLPLKRPLAGLRRVLWVWYPFFGGHRGHLV